MKHHDPETQLRQRVVDLEQEVAHLVAASEQARDEHWKVLSRSLGFKARMSEEDLRRVIAEMEAVDRRSGAHRARARHWPRRGP